MKAIALVPVIAGVLAVACGPAAGQEREPSREIVSQFVKDPMSFFFDLRAPEAIQCGQVVLRGEESLTAEQRKNVLTGLAAIYVSTGRRPQARAAFLQILTETPMAELDRPELLPPPVVRLFYAVRDSMTTASGRKAPLDIRTLAIGEIENNSIVKGAYDLDRFARGLTQIITTDLQAVTPLKIVDRQRLAVLLKEIQMGQEGIAGDPDSRVRFGQLSGAQSFLFGSVMQTDKKTIRLDLRWVQTETGAVLLSEGIAMPVRSSDDLFKLEGKVLLDLLVPQVQKMLSAEGEAHDIQGRARPYLEEKKKLLKSAYLDLLLKTGEAIQAEDRGDFASAAAAWREVGQMNPADIGATDRTRALQAYLDLGQKNPTPGLTPE